jgi:hypothetical protein
MVHSWYSLVAFTLIAHSSEAVAQVSTRTPVECRHFVSELEDPVNDSTWHLALVSIYDCPDQLGPTLVNLWRTLPTDSLKRDELYSASAHVHDGYLYHEIVYQAQDNHRPDSLRFSAIGALVTIANPNRLVTVPQIPGVLFSDTGVIVSVGYISHSFVRNGRNPLPSHVRDSVLALLRIISTSDSSAPVRRVARGVYYQLTYAPHSR